MAAAAARSAAAPSVAAAEVFERGRGDARPSRQSPAPVPAALEPAARQIQAAREPPKMLLGHFHMPEARVADLAPVDESAK